MADWAHAVGDEEADVIADAVGTCPMPGQGLVAKVSMHVTHRSSASDS